MISRQQYGIGDRVVTQKGVPGETRRSRRAQTLEFLEEAGFYPEDAKVLDIGCGPGSLSLPLTRAGADVTALDISTGMLNPLHETAELEGLTIDLVRCSWWSADIDDLGFREKFDLVIASMMPGIRDVETFDQRIACSEEFCYYSGFVKWGMDRAHREIYKKILKEEIDNRGPGMLYPFVYLYIKGHRPLIRFTHSIREIEQDWADAAERAIDFLGSRRDLSDDEKTEIKDHYRNSSQNGKYRSTSDMYTGMMVWTVTGR